jgi:hypothetical protein
MYPMTPFSFARHLQEAIAVLAVLFVIISKAIKLIEAESDRF